MNRRRAIWVMLAVLLFAALMSAQVVVGTPKAGSRICFNCSPQPGNKIAFGTIGASQCGPPFYCSSNQVANPGTITSYFTATEYVGKVNTTGNTVTFVSAPANAPQAFPTSCPNTHMVIANVNYTITLGGCTASTITLTSSAGNQSNANFAICEGQCQNSTTYDTTIPGHIANTDCITLLDDASTTSNGTPIGNFSCSGGMNNQSWSSLGDYVGPVTSGGAFRIHHTAKVNGCIQVLNPGLPPLEVTCPAGFALAPANDRTAFYMSGTQLRKTTWDANATVFLSDTQLVDFVNCPDVAGLPAVNTNSEMAESGNDDVYWQSFGPIGAQGTATVLAFFQVSTGKCRAVDLYTGNYYDWCCPVSSPGPCTPSGSCASESPLGTLSTTGNTCWGIPIWTGTVSVDGTGQNITWVSGHKFGFTNVQLLSMHFGSTACSPSGGVHCNFPFNNPSDNQHLTLVNPATALQLGCAGLPCTVTYSVINGIHAVQGFLSGNYVHVSFGAQGGWGILDSTNNPGNPPSINGSTNNPCAGATYNTQLIEIPSFGTSAQMAVTQWGSSFNNSTQGISGYQFVGHPSNGINNVVTSFFAGPNIRGVSDITHWSQFQGPNNTLFEDSHGFWPHFCVNKITGDDTCPWLQISDGAINGVGAGTCNIGGVGNPTSCPTYLNLVVFAWYPSVVCNPPTVPCKAPTIFAHNQICGGPSAPCADGTAATQFGEQFGIGGGSQDGTEIGWTSSALHGLGFGSDNNYFSGALGMVLF